MLLVKFYILRVEISFCEVENVVNFICSVNPFASQVIYHLVGLEKVMLLHLAKEVDKLFQMVMKPYFPYQKLMKESI